MKQTIDDQLLMNLAGQVGLDTSSASNRSAGAHPHAEASLPREAKEIAAAMKGKSDSEILAEIMKLKSVLQKNPGAYEKQIRAVKSLRGMMNPEQRQRLDQVLNLLER